MGSAVSRSAGAVAGALLLTAVFAASSEPAATGGAGRAAVAVRLDSQLRSLAAGRRVDGLVFRAGKVEVSVVARRGSRRAALAAVRRAGGRIEGTYRDLATVLLPPRSLAAVAANPGVALVTPPARPIQDAISEGVAATGANDWQAHGVTGRGVKVAVIDSSFASWKSFGFPAPDANGRPCDLTLSSHGTAVAKVVHEMAPGADLLLYCANDVTALGQAVEKAIAAKAKIIVQSLSWLATSRGDGTGVNGVPTPDGIAAAHAGKVLWVNSAGNFPLRHWSGTFQDTNGDRWLNFDGADQGNSFNLAGGATVCAFLKWDDWNNPGVPQDYDFYLYAGPLDLPNTPGSGSSLSALAVGANEQLAGSTPTERFCYTNQSTEDMPVFLSIFRPSPSPAPPQRLDLYITTSALQYDMPAGSLAEPADSPYVLAVGAACWQSWVLEDYSSRGPTIDGRVKPDLVAPESVSSEAGFGPFNGCGISGFRGTSASAPHVAGAAALVAQAHLDWSADQITSYLDQNAVDLGPAGKDNGYGFGRLALPRLSAPPPPPPPPPTPPAPLKLRLVVFQVSPKTLTAGSTLTARARVERSDTGALLRSGRVKCPAVVGASSLRPTVAGFSGGYARCLWRVPRTSAGRVLRGSLAVTYRGASVRKAFTHRIAKPKKAVTRPPR